jgi:hypothetical protein
LPPVVITEFDAGDPEATMHAVGELSAAGARAQCRAAVARARGGDFSVCAMLLLIAAIGTTRMACDKGRQAFTPPRGPFSLHPLVALLGPLLCLLLPGHLHEFP